MKRSRIGDLPMRVIYRMLAMAVAVVVAAVAAVAALIYLGSSDRPGGAPSGQVAAPLAATPSPGLSSPPASPEASATSAVPAPAGVSASPSAPAPASPASVVSASASPSVSPSVSASASSSVSGSPAASASPSPTGSPTAGPDATPSASPAVARDRSAVVAALADPRVPELPRTKKLARLPGKTHAAKRRLKDAKAGVSLVRFGAPWKIFGASPFSTKQVLPKVKGAATRAMLVSCPVPIQVQRSPRDTALLAARWTLNHHPRGSKISWIASQPFKKGWLLGYRVKYKVKGKVRSSVAAVAVTDVSQDRPAMVFVTIPDVQRSRWHDINTAISSITLK
ncbi:hypothetical protein [Streptosporangium sp. NPDC051022]|uniref:hypothetical protein n=1 Tax=Streptosporangium sp. NPDC051022 TaxID=3155752 RepID=UPI0034394717